MPRVMTAATHEPCELAEAVDALASIPLDPQDEGDLAFATDWLARLTANRDFLGDAMVDALCGRAASGIVESGYGPQAIVLSPIRSGCFLRANIWPAEADPCFAASGARSFVYGLPHDHNFSFLTSGYFGPGYRSDYYEYDYEAVAGYAGENAALRFVERSALEEGRLMLYRAHRDVHSQLPPESLSISLNVMAIDPAYAWYDQYGFDLDGGTVTSVLSPTSTECFLRIAVGMGGEEALDLADRVGRSHPSDRLRLASFEARAGRESDYGTRDNLWQRAERSGSLILAREAAARRAAL